MGLVLLRVQSFLGGSVERLAHMNLRKKATGMWPGCNTNTQFGTDAIFRDLYKPF